MNILGSWWSHSPQPAANNMWEEAKRTCFGIASRYTKDVYDTVIR